MTTITTRSGKGSPLTNDEVDANFTNLNTDKAELSGAAFTGAITTNSTFDGRDVATDGTKLDGIEASADVTDTANVTAAGALMDSELTSIASVKALNQGVATTDSPTFAGLTTTADVSFGDNDKAIFGASSDLQIYHDGTDSLIKDKGQGDLRLTSNGSGIRLLNDNETEEMANFQLNGAVTLYHDNAARLATSSTGIQVTGNISNASGDLTVDVAGSIKLDADSSNIYLADGGTDIGLLSTNNQDLNIRNLISNKDIYFQGNDGGSTITALTLNMSAAGAATFNSTVRGAAGSESAPTFLVDGSTGMFRASSNDIGFSCAGSEVARFDSSGNFLVNGTNATAKLVVDGAANSYATRFNSSTTTGQAFGARIRAGTNSSDYALLVENTSAASMFAVRGDGNVGIGQSSPASPLHVKSGANNDNSIITIEGATNNIFELGYATAGAFLNSAAGDPMVFRINETERMRLDASGNLLVGKTVNNTFNEGLVAKAAGGANITSAGDTALDLNRRTSDGTILNFRKDNTTIGSIASVGGADIKVVFSSDADQYITGNAAANYLSFSSANAERMRLDGSGNLGIGTATLTDSYKTIIDGSDQETANLTDAGTHGATLFLRATGENVGSGGAVAFGTTNGNQRPFAAIKGYVNDGTANSVGDLAFSTRATTSATALTERMRLTQSGRLVVGVNTPQGKLDVQSDGQYTPAAYFRNDGNATGWARADWFNDQASGTGIIYRDQAGSFVFRNDNSSGTAMTTRIVAGGTTAGNIVFNKDATGSGEVGRFDTSGNLLVGTTASLGTGGLTVRPNITQGAAQINFNRATTTNTSFAVVFQNAGSDVGSISYSNTVVAYNETSDGRLKENIVDAPSASDDIDAIQVRSFDWKVDGSHRKYGMIAQELNTVVPDAVTIPDDPEKMAGVDYSKLVPMLVKEIQSLRARVAQLEND